MSHKFISQKKTSKNKFITVSATGFDITCPCKCKYTVAQ